MEPLPLKKDIQEAQEFFGRKLRFTCGPWDLKTMEKQGVDFAILDLRRAEDYGAEHIPGALSLPEGRWPSLAGLSKTGVNVLYCYNQQCHLAARAALQFARAGYSVRELEGGFQAWKDARLGVERGEGAQEEPKSA